ncbi:hypothetical protein WKW50_16290 [Ochrobactrum sp. GPK 3]
MSTYLFRAECLLSKFGFHDGDILDDDAFDGVLPDDLSRHVPLIAAVRKYLLPLLDPRVEVFEIDSIHNPIRATHDTAQFVDTSIEVELSFHQIIDAFQEAEGEPVRTPDCDDHTSPIKSAK